EGERLVSVHKRVFGEEAAKRNEAQLTELAAGEDIPVNFNSAIFANTFGAHCLIAAASTQNRAELMVERLFQSYFVDGLNIADPTVLHRLATESEVTGYEDTASQVRIELE